MTPEIRRDDGSFWKASHKDTYSAMRALFDRTAPQFYFKRVERNPARRWWCPWRDKWRFTGEVWEGSDMWQNGFRVIQERKL